MNVRWLFLAAALWGLSSASAHRPSAVEVIHDCAAFLSEDGRALLGVDLARYPASNARTYADYGVGLWGLAEATAALGPDDLVVDNGAGLAVAGFWFAQHTSARYVAINGQNFWNDLRLRSHRTLFDMATVRGSVADHVQLATVGGVSIHTLETLATALAVENPFKRGLWKIFPALEGVPRSEAYQDQLRRYFSDIVLSYEKVVSTGRFAYHVGMTQTVLPTFAGQVALLLDAWGGYFYAIDRVQQLREIYRSLRPGGVALIHLSAGGWGPTDYVVLGSGEVPLLDYFSRRYRKSFHVHDFVHEEVLEGRKRSSPIRALVLRKDPGETVDFDFERVPTPFVEWNSNRLDPSIRFPDGIRYRRRGLP